MAKVLLAQRASVMPSARGAKLDPLPKERVTAFAFQTRVAVKADYTDRHFAIDRSGDTSSPFVSKAAAQLNSRNAFCNQVTGHLLGLSIVLCGYHSQLHCGRDHLTTMNGRVHTRRDKDESSF
jgi:hypothetical protein